MLLIGLLAITLAIGFPDRIFSRVLFAWQALAAAFGPLLVVTLWRGPVRPKWRIAALATGFLLTVVLSWTVDSPGDWVERLVPLAMALGLAWLGSRKSSGLPNKSGLAFCGSGVILHYNTLNLEKTMLRITRKPNSRISDRLAIFAALLLLVTSLAGMGNSVISSSAGRSNWLIAAPLALKAGVRRSASKNRSFKVSLFLFRNH